MIRIFLGLSFIFTQTAYAQFEEPPFCQPTEFMKYEVPVEKTGKMERVRAFKINGVTLVGVGVGKSDHVALQRLYHASAAPGAFDNKYCTWYLNKGNKTAARVFNHFPMGKPSSNAAKAAREWASRLGPIFEQNPNNIKQCLDKDKYVAMGCQGQQHRGPSGFGMMLSYLGCSPENSERITRNLWGLNGIKAASRVAINKEGKKIGDATRKRYMDAAAADAQRSLASLDLPSVEGETPPAAPVASTSAFFNPDLFMSKPKPTDLPPNLVTPVLPVSAVKPAGAPAEDDAPIVQTMLRPVTLQTGYGDNSPSGYGGSQQKGY